MTIEISEIQRVFRYNGIALPDVPGMAPREVRDLYSAQYPELISAEIEAGEVANGVQEYTFRKAVGTKGRTDSERLAALKAAVEFETLGGGKLAQALTKTNRAEDRERMGRVRSAWHVQPGRTPDAPRAAGQRHAGAAAVTVHVLPRIGPQVPCILSAGPLLALKAQVSRLLIEAEAFDESDLPPEWSDSLDACQHVLDRWLKRQIGPLHCLNPRFGLHMVSREGFQIGDFDHMPMPFELGAVAATWTEFDEREWVVGDSLTALNRQVAGLGMTVLHILRCKSTWVYPLFTPDIACDVASYLHWHGESDEETALDLNCGDDEDEREAMRAQMVSKASLDGAYPAWARQWPRGLEMPQCARLLRRAVKRLRDPQAKAIAADALALCVLEVDDSYRPDMDGEFIGFGGVLSWTPGDVTCEIYDDLRNLAYEGENCAHMGEIEVPMDDPGKFAAWQQAMSSRFEAIRLIDRLIHRLAAGD